MGAACLHPAMAPTAGTPTIMAKALTTKTTTMTTITMTTMRRNRSTHDDLINAAQVARLETGDRTDWWEYVTEFAYLKGKSSVEAKQASIEDMNLFCWRNY